MDVFLQFQGLPPDAHHCTSHREGAWVVWRCPYCTGYERRFNLETGEMIARRGGSSALHTGFNSGAQNMEALQMGIAEN